MPGPPTELAVVAVVVVAGAAGAVLPADLDVCVALDVGADSRPRGPFSQRGSWSFSPHCRPKMENVSQSCLLLKGEERREGRGTHSVSAVDRVVDRRDHGQEDADDENDDAHVEDAVEDHLGRRSDDVASLAQSPRNRVNQPDGAERGGAERQPSPVDRAGERG